MTETPNANPLTAAEIADRDEAVNRMLATLPGRPAAMEEIGEALADAEARDRAAGRQEGEPPSFPYAVPGLQAVGATWAATMTGSGVAAEQSRQALRDAILSLGDDTRD